MAFKINKNDLDVLRSIAEHRVLTTGQIRALHARSDRGMRNRLLELEEAGLVQTIPREFGHGQGRPERLLSLTDEAVALLRGEGIVPPGVPNDRVTAVKLPYAEHQILLNWFRVHLMEMLRFIPQLDAEFLSPTSPFMTRSDEDRAMISDTVPRPEAPDATVGFTPDGVFTLTDREHPKTVLFFLEVDRGTEPITSSSRSGSDVRQKIVNYQMYFHTHRYKRYEETWKCKLHGFRLLFLTCSDERLAKLCRLVRETPPSNFIWLTDDSRLFAQGLPANIWAEGGNLVAPPQSIVNERMACEAPIRDR
jgi:hypothetical protein